MASARAWLSPNSSPCWKSAFACCIRNVHSPSAPKGSTSSLGIFAGGGPIGELQVVDAGFVGKQLCLVAGGLFPQRTGSLAAFAEHGARLIEIAFINQRQRLVANGGKFWTVIPQPGKLCPQGNEFLCRRGELCRDFMDGNAGFAKLYQDRIQRRSGHTLLACHLFDQWR